MAAGLAGSLFAGDYQCRFAPAGWLASDWVLVKSPRWLHRGGWVQETECIRNATPDAATPEEMLGKRAGETYTSMVLKEPFTGNLRIEATLSFAHRMAPLVVLAPDLGQDNEGYPEYREHWEIVLFDQGVNVWHHTYADGRPAWHKAAFVRFAVKPEARYRLTVAVTHTKAGAQLTVRCGEQEFGYLEPDLPERLYAGITGCEGINRFYDFSVTQGK